MTPSDILKAYKAGKLSNEQLQQQLRDLQKHQATFPLSEGQKGLWALQEQYPQSGAYHLPICFQTNRRFDEGIFRRACVSLLSQFPILNATFALEQGTLTQKTAKTPNLGFTSLDLRQLGGEALVSFLARQNKIPISLAKGPLLRVLLISNDDSDPSESGWQQTILLTIHHIVFDGGSILPLISCLLDHYQQWTNGESPLPRPLSASYGDFVRWEHDFLNSETGAESLAYWQRQLAGPLPVLELSKYQSGPVGSDRAALGSGQTVELDTDRPLARRIRQLAEKTSVSPAVVFMAMFKTLLYRYTGQRDLIIGMPTLGRSQERFDKLVGYFVNMIPLRTQLDPNRPFVTLLDHVDEALSDGLDHAAFPFPALVKALHVPRNSAHAPVFQVAFAYQNFLQLAGRDAVRATDSDLELEFLDKPHQEGEYELTLEIFELEHHFRVNVKYDGALFNSDWMASFGAHLLTLAMQICENPEGLPSQYSFLSEAEHKRLLIDWNQLSDSAASWPAPHEFDAIEGGGIHHWVTRQARLTPNRIALRCGTETMIYAELEQRSDKLATYLCSKGVQPDQWVGLCLSRSMDLMVGVLGILKAGAAYVPMDPNYPTERLRFMVTDSGMALVVSDSAVVARLKKSGLADIDWLALDSSWSNDIKLSTSVATEHTAIKSRADDSAYLIYTSGSTGTPKGVAVSHASLVRYIQWAARTYVGEESGSFPLFTSVSFDLTVTSLFTPLVTGHELVIYPESLGEPLLERILREDRVDIIKMTPSHLKMIRHLNLPELRANRFILGGEDLNGELCRQITKNLGEKLTIFNEYGPTEATVGCMCGIYQSSQVSRGSVTLGKPADHANIYLLDDQRHPVPVGVAGEIYIGGECLAKGYINRPDLTNERFISVDRDSGLVVEDARIYKTGDLAYWCADGTMTYLGRQDHQVKIRGHRIELNEIEERLQTHSGVCEAVVLVRDRHDQQELVAFCTLNPTNDHKALTPRMLRSFIKAQLPEYMAPSVYFQLPAIPLTGNGKVDRDRLLSGEWSPLVDEIRNQAQTDTEKTIAAIWCEVLDRPLVDREIGFFEQGGDSILAVTIIDRINRRFDCDLAVSEMFKYHNVRELSERVASLTEARETVVVASTNSRPNRISQPSSTPKNDSDTDDLDDSMAIIGISCQFPGAANHREFWQNLRSGLESIRFFQRDELVDLQVPREIADHPSFIPVQSTIEGKHAFDPKFFHMTPRDAEFMDPQFRLLLLHAWRAMEDAGYCPKDASDTGVFMSASNSFYQALLPHFLDQKSPVLENAAEYISVLFAQGGTIPTMVSHKLGLKGPSYFVHSNCSSSLVGLYNAYQSLRSGDAKCALVGAATLAPFASLGYLHQKGLNFSSDGHVKVFDAEADGMVGGEGVAVLMLKRAADAIADGDPIYALIRGVALNNDGSDKAGFYAPSTRGQSQVIRGLLNRTGIHPETITYVEAHGTGTKLGDPVEVQALTDVYREFTEKRGYCGLGSVKSNLGHLDTAAGLAGCVKLALALAHQELPPSLNFRQPNPELDLANSPFYVVDRLATWPATVSPSDDLPAVPRRAALSSFGLGGTNGHAILEGVEPVLANQEAEDTIWVVPFSAKNTDRLQSAVRNMAHFLSQLKEQPWQSTLWGRGTSLAGLATTMQRGRQAMNTRVAFIARNLDELGLLMTAYLNGKANLQHIFEVGDAKQSAANLDLLHESSGRAHQERCALAAQAWVDGHRIDWALLDARNQLASGCRAISLPTYPFAEEQFPPPRPQLPQMDLGTPPRDEETLPVSVFRETWLAEAIDLTIADPKDRPSLMVCFLSDRGYQKAMSKAMARVTAGASPITLVFLTTNQGPSSMPDHSFPVTAGDPDSYARAFESIFQIHGSADTMLYLWALENASFARDYASLSAMFRAMAILAEKGIGEPPKHLILAGSVAEIHDEPANDHARERQLDRCYLESWMGYQRSLGLLLPKTKLSLILEEVPTWEWYSEPRGLAFDQWAPRLFEECFAPRGDTVWFVRGKRLVADIEALELETKPSIIREGKTYLITGGMGGLGFQLAEILAEAYSANLILAGRKPLDDHRSAKLERLRMNAGKIAYIQAELTDEAAFSDALIEAKSSCGPIHGVIHCAGIEAAGNIFAKSQSEFDRVLAPKVAGTLVLDSVLKDEPLEFTAYFSSASAILGDFGSCDYAIANRFQTAHAKWRNALWRQGNRPGKACVIHWPAWRDGGMASADRDQQQTSETYLQASGQRFLESAEGMALFQQLLNQEHDQHLVLAAKPNRLASLLRKVTPQRPGQELPEPVSFEERVEPVAVVLDPADLKSRLIWDLKKQASSLIKLSMDRLSDTENLVDFGFDSISLTEYAAALTAHYSTSPHSFEFTPALFFGYGTFAELGQYLLDNHAELIQSVYNQKPSQPEAVSLGMTDRQDSAEFSAEMRTIPVSVPSDSKEEPIAIIGLSGRFPDARDIHQLWDILASSREVVVDMPEDRFAWRELAASLAASDSEPEWRSGWVPGVREFDPLFFEISPLEAETMDPRQRLLLQESWRALEDAGLGPATLKAARVGTFVGVEEGDYQFLTAGKGGVTANHSAVLASRLAYFLNFSGPTLALNTACSSGLVAAHQACLSLRQGECDVALAAGVHLTLTAIPHMGMAQAGMLSPDGRCYAFGEQANGMVPGEAVAVVVLKRLSQALADGDPIHALIKGSGVNYDGKTNGLTAPSMVAQANLIEQVQSRYQVDPSRIDYVVTHGTGTKLGDPVEINALAKAFGTRAKQQQIQLNPSSCALTSNKTNLGHTLAASGLVNLINMVQAMRHETIPASLNCERESSFFQWQDSPFFVNTEARPWVADPGRSRLGAISAFGVSGTNAHMVLESFEQDEANEASWSQPLFPLLFSAKSRDALVDLLVQVADRCALRGSWERALPLVDSDLAKLSAVLAKGRHHLPVRAVLIAASFTELTRALERWQKEGSSFDAQPSMLFGEVKRTSSKDTDADARTKEQLAQYKTYRDSTYWPGVEVCRDLLNDLGQAFTRGSDQAWETLAPTNSKDNKPLDLPTQPFAKEHYWVEAEVARPVEPTSPPRDPSLLLCHPEWVTLSDRRQGASQVKAFRQHSVFLCEATAFSAEVLQQEMSVAGIADLWQEEGFGGDKPHSLAERFVRYARRLAGEITRWVETANQDRDYRPWLCQIVVPLVHEKQASSLFQGLFGLIQTARLEHPRFKGQVIGVSETASPRVLADSLVRGAQFPELPWLQTDHHQLSRFSWCELPQAARTQATAQLDHDLWNDEGVYLITGGAGQLGRVVVSDILDHCQPRAIVLAGRSAASTVSLVEFGDRVSSIHYRQVNLGNQDEVQSLIAWIGKTYGKLSGLLHLAGVHHDNYLIRKPAEEWDVVLSPKVAGTLILDEATRATDLEFFLLFSSASGCIGSPGQADYAAANAFLDCFASVRNQMARSGSRRGRTLSLIWPLWRDGGMQVDEQTEANLSRNTGMVPLARKVGMAALHEAWHSGQEQVMALSGDVPRIRAWLLAEPEAELVAEQRAMTASMSPDAPHDGEALRTRTITQLVSLFGTTIKLKIDRIDAGEELERYGIDSIMITKLNQVLGETFASHWPAQEPFEELSKTLFFEYPTLESLGDFLAEAYPQVCLNWTGLAAPESRNGEQTQQPATPDQVTPVSLDPVVTASERTWQTEPSNMTNQALKPEENEAIAVIGVVGHYPKSPDLDAFWNNLQAGMDCISEIPADRWPVAGFYESDPDKAVEQGKSYSKWGGFVEGFADFDPLFFHISPREAVNMDPQERWFVMACWSLLEQAGYTRARIKDVLQSRVGVFAGITRTGFNLFGPPLWHQGEKVAPTTAFASVANRISYLLDLKGPSLPIDTMCSSSLTAIHEACEHIRRGECEMAIAGGVNLYTHPSSYVGLCGQRMLASDGRCKSFGLGGDGFVPGEGVGVVLLKRYHRALADGDPIWGLIRASGVNHDGKTNGYTVPNPNAQAALIREVLEKADVDARTISYVEAHGTGTELGDPIEVTGLTHAFGRGEVGRDTCALGSVKSNIGHLEAAAGVAGLTKILLQMKHQTIAPSLHASELNPNIAFDRTPFSVVRKADLWERPQLNLGDGMKSYPRRASISSFGAGGANAHVLLEEYVPESTGKRDFVPEEGRPAIILISAKTEAALLNQVRGLAKWTADRLSDPRELDGHEAEQTLLWQVAYTLQHGRECMDERLAFTALSLQGLHDALGRVVNASGDVASFNEIFRANTRDHVATIAPFLQDEELSEAVEKWLAKGKYERLLDLWTKGLNVSWVDCYDQQKPTLIPLPSYPFNKKKFWLPELKPQVVAPSETLHPLVQHNLSTLERPLYRTFLRSDDPWLVDQGDGSRLLPATLMLEMVRVATGLALADPGSDPKAITIPDNGMVTRVTWLEQPLVSENLELKLALKRHADEIAFEITRVTNEGDRLCCFGVWALQAEHQPRPAGISSTELKQLSTSHEAARQDSLIELTQSVPDEAQSWMMTPVVNAAIQNWLNRLANRNAGLKNIVPIHLKQLFFGQLQAAPKWLWIKRLDKRDQGFEADVQVLSEKGDLLMSFEGLDLAPQSIQLSQAFPMLSSPSDQAEPVVLNFFHESWQPEDIQIDTAKSDAGPMVCFLSNPEYQDVWRARYPGKVAFIAHAGQTDEKREDVFVFSGLGVQSLIEALHKAASLLSKIGSVVYLWALEDRSYIAETSQVAELLKAIVLAGVQPKQVVLAGAGKDLDLCHLRSWVGFERALKMPLPDMPVYALLRESKGLETNAMASWVELILRELQAATGQSTLYRGEQRHICKVTREKRPSSNREMLEGKTVLITGGMGSLGSKLARHLVAQGVRRLALTGRSDLTKARQQVLDALLKQGCQAVYLQVDVASFDEMEAGLARATRALGPIHGIVHAAGLEATTSLFETDVADFERVLRPKIQGAKNLQRLLSLDELDFFVSFSSTSATLGDFGCGSYAVANRFLMAHAEMLRAQGFTKAIAVNWPLWKEGGMGSFDADGQPSATTAMYLKSSGQRMLDLEEGLEIFDAALTAQQGNLLVFAGQPTRVQTFIDQATGHRSLLRTQAETKPSTPLVVSSAQTKVVTDQSSKASADVIPSKRLRADLVAMMGELLGTTQEDIDDRQNWADFGFDSISLADFSAHINQKLEIDCSPALFFSHPTLASLTAHLLERHNDHLAARYQSHGVHDSNEAAADQPARDVATHSLANSLPMATSTIIGADQRFSWYQPKGGLPTMPATEHGAIAIVGMSGRFPGARNIDELWQLLKEGRLATRSVPTDRLDLWRSVPGMEGADPNWRAGYLEDVGLFDSLFFEISPREAEHMDPRQRLLLEEAWSALEDAGVGPNTVNNRKLGMFVGAEEGDYGLFDIAGEAGITANHNGIMASRLSYFLNLNGPALAINTACSSGLMAVHEACNSLRNGDCDTALAAGVNLLLTPFWQMGMAKSGMLSPDHTCYAFDERANGMIPGEAVAVVVLRPLERALAEGDAIHGVIRASGVNYDGRTNGITAPNGKAQSELITSVMRRADVAPRDIGHVVTHGTGTKLGDPVEIQALNEAYGELEPGEIAEPYCALTSTKTNMGHTLAASGLVSLVSLLLSLKNEAIPASLNCEKENQFISWQQSAFFVNKRIQPWPKLQDRARLGAVSAFGMSGTNVHMLVEAAPTIREERRSVVTHSPRGMLLILSAKTEPALNQRMVELLRYLTHLDRNTPATTSGGLLTSLSYSLAEGRFPFKHRFAMVVDDIGTAINRLEQALAGEDFDPALVFRGKVPRQLSFNSAEEQRAGELGALLHQVKKEQSSTASADYQALLAEYGQMFCRGFQFDWSELFRVGEDNPGVIQKLHLPTYPFQRQPYWIPMPDLTLLHQPGASRESLMTGHHLRPRVGSSLPSYNLVLSGQEFFIADHVIADQPTLPAVVYWELLRKAVWQILDTVVTESHQWNARNLMIENMAWMTPLTFMGEAIELEIDLKAEGKDLMTGSSVKFEIIGKVPNPDDKVLISKGTLRLGGEQQLPTIDPTSWEWLDEEMVEIGEDMAAVYANRGMNYGPSFRAARAAGIERNADSAFAKVWVQLRLDGQAEESDGQFGFHPGLVDSALQCSLFLPKLNSDAAGEEDRARVPFTVDLVTYYQPCTSQMWASIAYSQASANKKMTKYDVQLFNDQGEMCAWIKGFCCRLIRTSPDPASQADDLGTLVLEPVWKDIPCEPGSSLPNFAVQEVWLCGWGESEGVAAETDRLREILGQKYQVQAMPWQDREPAEAYLQDAKRLFSKIKQLFVEKPGQMRASSGPLPWLLQVVVPEPAVGTMGSVTGELCVGLAGLLKSARMENPNLRAQLIQVPRQTQVSQVAQWLELNQQDRDGVWARFTESLELGTRQQRWVQFWQERNQLNNLDSIGVWRPKGVYLITGGAGGLGSLLAQSIVSAQPQATVILLGRSKLSGERLAWLESLRRKGYSVKYHAVDVADQEALNQCLTELDTDCSQIHGVIHAAGVVRDGYILRKQDSEWDQVLSAKVRGTVYLDRATKDHPLDFFVCFSSTTGALGNPGQADYACANAFMDAYMEQRQRLVTQGEYQGKSLAVNWPLWAEGGMRIDPSLIKAMRRQSGLMPLATNQGLAALAISLESDSTQTMVVQGELARIRQNLVKPEVGESLRNVPSAGPTPTTVNQSSSSMTEEHALITAMQAYVTELLSKTLKLPPEAIEIDAPLEEYGIDSILVIQMTEQLEESFGSLSKTLFFEYDSIQAVCAYFLNDHRTQVISLVGSPVTTAVNQIPIKTIDEKALSAWMQTYVTGLLSKTLKLPPEAIEIDAPLEEYGIDSILVIQMTEQLEESFGSLSKTLFFEYDTIQAVCAYFLNDHRAEVERLVGSTADDVIPSLEPVGMALSIDTSMAAAHYFRDLLSKALKLAPEEIETDASLEEYGIDSMLINQMTEELEEVFGSGRATFFL